MNKRKIINDAVYGFVQVPSELLFELIEHPYFQRLRRIRQLGIADLVYPGATHHRFAHALGAMHLMGQALETLRSKGHYISENEAEAAQVAILLHDIGHGPFSHVLEHAVLAGVPHEAVSLLMMEHLNAEKSGRLSLAIDMFRGSYYRKFFHQLISSQLDMDRMDYLVRDSFYTGVVEGAIGADRLIKMLDVADDQLVVEEKGLLSIENFLTARRFMYWQVYLHKTLLCAETMLFQIFRRAKELYAQQALGGSEALGYFLTNRITINRLRSTGHSLEQFVLLDDYDIWTSIKQWATLSDPILSVLSKMLLERQFFKLEFVKEAEQEEHVRHFQELLLSKGVKEEALTYLVNAGSIGNSAYLETGDKILVKMKTGEVVDVAMASDLPAISALSKIVHKYYVCWAKNVSLRA